MLDESVPSRGVAGFEACLSLLQFEGEFPESPEKGPVTSMDIAVLAQVLSFPATFVVAAGILYQGREARRARNGKNRP